MDTITFRMAGIEDRQGVLSLLEKLDKAFSVPLSERVELAAFTDKLIMLGKVNIALHDDVPVGLIGYYANNYESKVAYVTVLGVLDACRGRGIAARLLESAVTTSRECMMERLALHTDRSNEAAIGMYLKHGFSPKEDPARPDSIKFVKKL